MRMKNLLFLHEAIVIALVNQPTRTANFDEIARFIEDRNLYPKKRGNISLAKQIMLRSTKSNGAYEHLFEEIGAGYISLKDNLANVPKNLANALDAILDYNYELFHPPAKLFGVVDIELGQNKKIKLSPEKVVCIIAKNIEGKKTGNKKFIYVIDTDTKNEEVIRVYTIQSSFEKLLGKIDPLRNYLAIVSEGVSVNVAYYNIGKNKVLKPTLEHKEITSIQSIKFPTGKPAKINQEKYELIQRHYLNRISLQKKVIGYKNDFRL